MWEIEWIPPVSVMWAWQLAVLTIATAFFLCFPVADLGAAVGLSSGVLSLAVFLVAVTVCCLRSSVTG